jgi:pimeloyl-ACP methyl ester carboxylesterase
MKSITLGNTSWRYLEQGNGPALVLVHGFPLDHRIWLEQVRGLSQRFRVIAVDLKGFGQSASSEAFTIDSMADELAEFMKAVGAAPCVLAGLSMGGYIAFSLAVRRPEVLKGLLIVCSKAEADTPQGKEGRQKMAELAQTQGAKPVSEQMLPRMFAPETISGRPELVAQLRQIMEGCPPTTIANACFAMRDRADRTTDLPKLTMPVQVILGEKDVIIPAEMGHKMAGACQRGRFVLIPKAGHLACMEEPAAVNEAMAAFTAECSRL